MDIHDFTQGKIRSEDLRKDFPDNDYSMSDPEFEKTHGFLNRGWVYLHHTGAGLVIWDGPTGGHIAPYLHFPEVRTLEEAERILLDAAIDEGWVDSRTAT